MFVGAAVIFLLLQESPVVVLAVHKACVMALMDFPLFPSSVFTQTGHSWPERNICQLKISGFKQNANKTVFLIILYFDLKSECLQRIAKKKQSPSLISIH